MLAHRRAQLTEADRKRVGRNARRRRREQREPRAHPIQRRGKRLDVTSFVAQVGAEADLGGTLLLDGRQLGGHAPVEALHAELGWWHPPLLVYARRGASQLRDEPVVAVAKRDALHQPGACEVETARNLNADFVITGMLATMSGKQVLSLKMHETKTGTLVGQERTSGDDVLSLLDKVGPMVVTLLKP